MEAELGRDAKVEVYEGKKSRIKIEKLFDFEPRGYYVYVHRKMTNGEIFYVGKGRVYVAGGRTLEISSGRIKLKNTEFM